MCKNSTSIKRNKKSSHQSSLSRFFKLNWTSKPTRILPHGSLGAISLTVGTYLTICSFLGDLSPYTYKEGAWLFPSWSFLVYFWSMMLSGIVGYQMAPYAQPHLRFLFRFLGLELCFLSYFALRLMPTFAMSVGHTAIVRLLDMTMSSGMLLLIFYGMHSITGLVIQGKVPLAQGLASYPAFLSLATLTPFPLHMGHQGQDWYKCAHEEFPILGYTTAAYAYVPATVVFSIVAFSASLYLRKIIGTRGIVLAFSSVVLTLVVTVLSMEYYVPFVSVQRLYLPCPMPENNPFQETLVRSVDLSPVSQSILKYMGFEVKAPDGF